MFFLGVSLLVWYLSIPFFPKLKGLLTGIYLVFSFGFWARKPIRGGKSFGGSKKECDPRPSAFHGSLLRCFVGPSWGLKRGPEATCGDLFLLVCCLLVCWLVSYFVTLLLGLFD